MSFSAPQHPSSAQWPAPVNFHYPAPAHGPPQPQRYPQGPPQPPPAASQYTPASAPFAQPAPSPRTPTVNGYHPSPPPPPSNGTTLPPYAAPQPYAHSPLNGNHYTHTPQQDPQSSSVSHTPQQQFQPLPPIDLAQHQDTETHQVYAVIKTLQTELHHFSHVHVDPFDLVLFPIDPRTGQKMTDKGISGLSARYERMECSAAELKLFRAYLENLCRAKAEKAGVTRQAPPLSGGFSNGGAFTVAGSNGPSISQAATMSRPDTSGSMGPPQAHQRLPSGTTSQMAYGAMGQALSQMTPSQQQAYHQNNTQVFHRKLVEFHSQSPNGVPTFPATIDGRPINLYKLYYYVTSAGGSTNVSLQGPGPWQKILHGLEIPLPQGSSMYREDTIRALQTVWGRYLSSFEATVKVRAQAQQAALAAAATGSQHNGQTPASPVIPLQHGSPPPGMQGVTGPGTPREATSQAGTPVASHGTGAMSPSSRPSSLASQFPQQTMPSTFTLSGYPQPLSVQTNHAILPGLNSASHLRQSSVPVTPTISTPVSSTFHASTPPQHGTGPAAMSQMMNQFKANGTAAPAAMPVHPTSASSAGPHTSTVKSRKSTPVHSMLSLGPPPEKAEKAPIKRKRGKKDEDSPALSVATVSRSASVTAPVGPGPFTLLLANPFKPSASTTPSTDKKIDPPSPPVPAGPVPRKRKRVEYCPLTKPADFSGGWEIQMAEEGMARVAQARGRRSMEDLGFLDINALTLSLRSRLAPEVVYALNALNLLAQELRTHPQDPYGVLELRMDKCDELLEELVALLEETAFDDFGDDAEPIDALASKSSTSMRQDLIMALEQEARISHRTKYGRKPVRDVNNVDDLRPLLGQMEIILSILNIIRAFASCEENGPYMCADPRLLSVLVNMCGYPASVKEGKRVRDSLEVVALDRLRIRRDVLQILSDLGHHLQLKHQSVGVCTSILELAAYFLEDGVDIPRSTTKVDAGTPTGQADITDRQLQRKAAMSGHVEAALGILSRAALSDSNRSALSRCDVETQDCLIDLVIMILPLTQEEFMDLHDEGGLTRVEMETMALFNLVFLSPNSMKRKLHQSPFLGRAVVRLIEPLIAYSPVYNENPYSVLIERSIEVLNVCAKAVQRGETDHCSRHDYDGLNGNGNDNNNGHSPDRLDWFGGGFVTEEGDGANSGVGGTKSELSLADVAPPLSGLRSQVESILKFQGIGQVVFDSLSILLNGQNKTTRG